MAKRIIPDEEIIKNADLFLSEKSSLRKVAKKIGITRQTLLYRLTTKLSVIDAQKYEEVRKILDKNKEESCMRALEAQIKPFNKCKNYKVSELYILTVKCKIPTCYAGDEISSIRINTEYFIGEKVNEDFADVFSNIEIPSIISQSEEVVVPPMFFKPYVTSIDSLSNYITKDYITQKELFDFILLYNIHNRGGFEYECEDYDDMFVKELIRNYEEIKNESKIDFSKVKRRNDNHIENKVRKSVMQVAKSGRVAIRCQTEEEAETLLSIFDSEGLKWCDEKSLIGRTCWKCYGRETCYTLVNHNVSYCGCMFYASKGFEIIDFNQIQSNEVKI